MFGGGPQFGSNGGPPNRAFPPRPRKNGGRPRIGPNPRPRNPRGGPHDPRPLEKKKMKRKNRFVIRSCKQYVDSTNNELLNRYFIV